MTERKEYLLDTNILLQDPDAIERFAGNDVYICLKVIEELDSKKKGSTALAHAARTVTRKLRAWAVEGDTDRSTHPLAELYPLNVEIENDIRVVFWVNREVISGYKATQEEIGGDNAILEHASALNAWLKKISGPRRECIIVTNDAALCVRALALGFKAESYESGTTKTPELFAETRTIEAAFDPQPLFEGNALMHADGLEIKHNEYAVLKTGGSSILIRGAENNHFGKTAYFERKGVYGIKPINLEQNFAMDALMDPKIQIVAITGKAGTGKNLLTIAAALQQVVESSVYEKLVVTRTPEPFGKELGYLPGPQPLTAGVLTPSGWTTMGAVQPGDLVIGKNGAPVVVDAIRPHGEQMVYRVTTSDGRKTEATADHLWLTQTFEEKKRGRPGKVRTTQEIMMSLTKKTKTRVKHNHYLPTVGPVQFEKRELPIDPYLLGVLLGDGCFSKKDGPVTVAIFDEEIYHNVANVLPDDLCFSQPYGKGGSYNIVQKDRATKAGRRLDVRNNETGETSTYATIGFYLERHPDANRSTISHRATHCSSVGGETFSFQEKDRDFNNSLKSQLDRLGLLGLVSYDKFVPEDYLFSSVEDRLAILRGLMDTDGTCKKNGEATFSTTSSRLSDSVKELVRSLGGKSSIRVRDRVAYSKAARRSIAGREIISTKVSYEVQVATPLDINPFLLTRKAANYNNGKLRHGIMIEAVEPVGLKEVQCLVLGDEDHLYVTDDYILTHNSIGEKMGPWLRGVMDAVEFLHNINQTKTKKGRDPEYRSGEKVWQDLVELGKAEIQSPEHVRGASIAKTFFVLDESQNLTVHEMKTFLSRMGEGSKIVLLGDPWQIDSSIVDIESNGLSVFIDRAKANDQVRELFAHINLTITERSRVAALTTDLFA